MLLGIAIAPAIPLPNPKPLAMGLRKEFLEAYRRHLRFEAAPETSARVRGVKLHWSRL